MHNIARGQPIPSICSRERHRSDGEATMLYSGRTDLAVFRGCYEFESSMHRWGGAGRSYPSHSTLRSPPRWWERGSWRVAPIQPQAGIGRGSVWAFFARRKFSPNPVRACPYAHPPDCREAFECGLASATNPTDFKGRVLDSMASGQRNWPSYPRRSQTRKSPDGRASMGATPFTNSESGQ